MLAAGAYLVIAKANVAGAGATLRATLCQDGVPMAGGSATGPVSSAIFALVFDTAVTALANCQCFRARDVDAAVRTGDGVLGWWQGRALRWRLHTRAALPAQPGIHHHQNDQNDQVFHKLRPSITSSTKREPT